MSYVYRAGQRASRAELSDPWPQPEHAGECVRGPFEEITSPAVQYVRIHLEGAGYFPNRRLHLRPLNRGHLRLARELPSR
jgi:hypothetical protein